MIDEDDFKLQLLGVALLHDTNGQILKSYLAMSWQARKPILHLRFVIDTANRNNISTITDA
jgi:hypothetical protein